MGRDTKRVDPSIRFDEGWVDSLVGCHLWGRSRAGNGYGQFRSTGWVGQYAHRFSYERAKGPIPKGYDIDHLCRVIHCVNPDHLEAVTRAENLRRALEHYTPASSCPRGHVYDEENTRYSSGRRRCRTCHNEETREAKRRKRTSKPAKYFPDTT